MSDLDDDEFKATRRLNGVDKENYNIEKDIERCKQLIKVEQANWIGISNQLAIKHILEEREQDKKKIKELKEQVKMLDEAYIGVIKESKKWFDIAHNSIPVQKVKDIVKEAIEIIESEQFKVIMGDMTKVGRLKYLLEIELLEENK